MPKRQLTIIGIVLIAATILFAITTFRQQAQDKSQQKESNDAPILNYDVEIIKATNKESKEKSKRFNNISRLTGNKQIGELPPGVEPIPTINHWWIGLSALPVTQSTTVVVGEITEAVAHLSEDKTGIYSEFLVQVNEVFKDTSSLINVDSTLSTTREGGSIQFASGRINKYRIAKQGMPQKGGNYLLFLKREESGNYSILTGYKLSKHKVTPLDGEDNKQPGNNLPFAKYREADELNLMQDLRTALQTSRDEGSK